MPKNLSPGKFTPLFKYTGWGVCFCFLEEEKIKKYFVYEIWCIAETKRF